MTPLTREQFEERLALAEQNVERARNNVARQQRILASLRKGDRPTAEGEMLLERLEHSIRVYEEAEHQLRRQLERGVRPVESGLTNSSDDRSAP
jgi:hypothetical protein